MKSKLKLLLLIIGLIFIVPLYAQKNISISEYDDESIRTFDIPNLFENFENALNIISYSKSEPLDYKIIINRLLYNSEVPRTFYSDKVIVENDITNHAIVNTQKEDLSIKDYLHDFEMLYPKTEDPSVTFNILKISHLKKSSYFYYNVFFESLFKNKDNNGNAFKSFRRKAEIRLEYDSVWRPYIAEVDFALMDENLDDSKNNFVDFIVQNDRTTDSKIQNIKLNKESEKSDNLKMNLLIAEGDIYFLQEKYSKALDSYKLARSYNTYPDDLKDKIKRCEDIINNELQAKKLNEANLEAFNALKIKIIEYFNKYEFEICKIYYDSLIKCCSQFIDSDLISINKELNIIIPFIEKTQALKGREDYEGMLNYSTRIVKSQKEVILSGKPLLLAEALYRSARAYYLFDRTDLRNISEYCEEALRVSGNAHLPCQKFYIHVLLLSNKDKFKALGLATEMVERYPNKIEPILLRAYVYDYLGDSESAIKDYQKAIDNNALDTATYINKGRLEYSIHKYSECITSTNEGLKIFQCNSSLLYLRILAEEELGNYKSAGDDFDKALKCGLNGGKKDTIINHGKKLYESGISCFDSNKLGEAIDYFNKSYELTHDLIALYYRGYTELLVGDKEKALNDLNDLISMDSTYKHAYYVRGLINAATGKNDLAILDYKKQIILTPEYWKSYAMLGKSFYNLKRYGEAAKYFKEATQYKYTDSIAAYTILSNLKAEDYKQAISASEQYIKVNKSNYKPLFKYRGIAEYNSGLYFQAEKDLRISLIKNSDDYETRLYLIKTFIACGEETKAIVAADDVSNMCRNCAEATLWWGIASILQQDGSNINRPLA